MAANIRYVATYVNKDGERTMIGPAQGRHTYATEREARAQIDAMRTNNGPRTLADAFGEGAAATFEVRPVECWPGHNDPKTVWFE